MQGRWPDTEWVAVCSDATELKLNDMKAVPVERSIVQDHFYCVFAFHKTLV